MADSKEKKNTHIWTIIDLIKWGSDFFKSKGIDSPRLNIELMLCDILNYSRIEIYTNFDKPLNQNELSKLRNYVIRRASKEPLQYILGYEFFYGNKFLLNDSTLIPRPETELLVEKAINYIKKNYNGSVTVADFCSGSGCIGISIKKALPKTNVFLYDISEKAIDICKENAKLNNIDNIIIQKKNLLIEKIENKKFDFILSNPPYIPINEINELQAEIKNWEPRIAYCDESDGLTFYRKFKNLFDDNLVEGGCALLEFGYKQEKELVKLFENQFETIEIIEDFNHLPRVLFLKGKK